LRNPISSGGIRWIWSSSWSWVHFLEWRDGIL
jgi:hypothetical protein